jgi:hypothetical protein
LAVSRRLTPASLDWLLDQGAGCALAQQCPGGVAPPGFSKAHAAKADRRDVEAGAAEFDVLHVSQVFVEAFGDGPRIDWGESS